MRILVIVFFLWCGIPGRPATAAAETVDDAAVRRAELEVNRVQGLVSSGMLPRIKLEEAQSALADARDEAAIRSALYKKDISVDEADQLVDLTAKRVARRQITVNNRGNLAQQGIIARSELGDAQAALDTAQRDLEWAESRAKFAREMAELAKTEQELMRQLATSSGAASLRGVTVEHFVGSNRFDMSEFPAIEHAFTARFAHVLPISAMGETGVHRALGFDHRNRVDVALQPDQPEGQWLRRYLTAHNIPFFAFRMAVPGKATGAHIHIGPPSDHYVANEHLSSQKRTL